MHLVNGEPYQAVDVADRGLHYGDGLFETIAAMDGCPLLWVRHIERLEAGCKRLGIPMPAHETLRREIQEVCPPAGPAVLKIIVTRGVGGRGYASPEDTHPTRIVSSHSWPEHLACRTGAGIPVRICATRLSRNRDMAGIKHLNRLEQVLARSEWSDTTIPEGLMCDDTGAVIEGTSTNLFLVDGGRLYTPELSNCGVAGVMRAHIMEAADSNDIPVEEVRIELEDLESADELFLTNCVIGVWPIASVAGHHWQPGTITRRIITLVKDVTVLSRCGSA